MDIRVGIDAAGPAVETFAPLFPWFRVEFRRAHFFGDLDLVVAESGQTNIVFDKDRARQLRIGESDGLDQSGLVGGLNVNLGKVGRFHDRILQMPFKAIEHFGAHRGVLGAAEEFQVNTLGYDRGHIGIGHGRRPCFGPVDQALFQAVKRFFPCNRNRVQVHDLHGDPAKLGAGHAVLGAEQFFQLRDGRLVLPFEAELNAAQFAMAEQEFQSMALLQGIAQDPLTFR